MGAHLPMPSERLARGRAAGEDWARIDPRVFVAEGRLYPGPGVEYRVYLAA